MARSVRHLRRDRRHRRELAPVEAVWPEDAPAHRIRVVLHRAAETEVPAPR
jgi:hypothetical protein